MLAIQAMEILGRIVPNMTLVIEKGRACGLSNDIDRAFEAADPCGKRLHFTPRTVANACEMAVRALEREKPRELTYTDHGIRIWANCPECGAELAKIFYAARLNDLGPIEYCPFCGTRIVYSESWLNMEEGTSMNGKKYIDSKGQKYRVMPGIGHGTYKARCQKADKHGSEGWRGMANLPWRDTYDEAQADLDRLAAAKNWDEWTEED